MKTFLSHKNVSGRACGKAILMGEHAAVYGYPAVAIALPDVSLEIFCEGVQPLEVTDVLKAHPATWDQAWVFIYKGESLPMQSAHRQKLTQSLQMALDVCGAKLNLSNVLPSTIEVRTLIPLSAGMGGSAAISTALIRLVQQIMNCEATWCSQETAILANKVDGLFHGSASGLDTAAVASNGIIEFIREKGIRNLRNGVAFWAVLIDSGERSHTVDMVQHVATLLKDSELETQSLLKSIGDLSKRVAIAIEQGSLKDLGQCLNEGHAFLSALHLSTASLDAAVDLLRTKGAVGAKVTGAGGGGLALGVFATDPTEEFKLLMAEGRAFLTRVEKN